MGSIIVESVSLSLRCVPFFFIFFFHFFFHHLHWQVPSSNAPANSVITCTGGFRHHMHWQVPSSFTGDFRHHTPANSVITHQQIPSSHTSKFRHHTPANSVITHRHVPSSHTGTFRNHMHRLTAFHGKGICFTASSSSSRNKCLSKPETVSLRDLFQMRIQELLERKQDVIWRDIVQ